MFTLCTLLFYFCICNICQKEILDDSTSINGLFYSGTSNQAAIFGENKNKQ